MANQPTDKSRETTFGGTQKSWADQKGTTTPDAGKAAKEGFAKDKSMPDRATADKNMDKKTPSASVDQDE